MAVPTDLIELARHAHGAGALLALAGEDLNVNLVALDAGKAIAEHVNEDVEVLIVGVAGSGCVSIDGEERTFNAGHAALIRRGCRRSIRAGVERLVWLTCHRRRGGLSIQG